MWNPLSAPSEDCLYLNVYVPKPAQSTAPSSNKMSSRSNKLAVMVWIYGGGFYSGSSYLDVYDGKYLAVTSDTIVVTVNYRLGALGFLTLKDPLTPPNVGLYDQLMSLEWIRNNIAFFGGDPDNITIFGESAGAVSVSLHLLSPLSHDKFHRAIMQSGTANMPWGVIPMLEAQKRATEFVKLLGCAETKEAEIADIAQAMNCMKSMPAKAIVDYQWVTRNIMQFPFIPVIDGVFVPDDPVKLLERREFKKCPILIGSNANEASFFIIYELDSQFNLTWKSMTRDDYSTSLTKLFFYYPQYPINMPYRGLEAVKFQYTPWSDLDDVDKNIYALDMAVSDSQFICPLNIFARSYSSAGQDVYAYYFTQRIKNHVWPEWMGVLHGDEILFMFSEVTKWKNNYTYEEQELSKKMILYWSNFAKTGNPNTSPGAVSLDEWPLHSISHQEYLELNTKYLDSSNKWRAVGKGPRIRECAFWNTYLPNLLSDGYGQENKKIFPCKPTSELRTSGSASKAFGHSLYPLVVSVAVVRQLLATLDSRWSC